MFLTYLPTSLKAKRHETITIDQNLIDKISFRVSYNHDHRPKVPEALETTLDGQEYRPSFVLMQGMGIPLCTGVIVFDNDRLYPYDGLGKPLMVGYDAKKNTYQNLDPVVRPETFSGCSSWANVLKFDEFIFNMLARATGLKTTLSVNTPTYFNFNFLNKEGKLDEHTDPLIAYYPEKVDETFIAFHGKYWVKINGKTVVDLNTEKVTDQTFNKNDALMYMLENEHHRYVGHKFRFIKPHYQSINEHKVLQVNVPTTIDDPEVGKKLYDALGIEYDVYDEVKMEDGNIDTEIFMKGKHHFGVLKSKVLLLDDDAIKVLVEKRLEEENLKDDDDNIDRDNIFNFKRGNAFGTLRSYKMLKEAIDSYLTINYDGEVDDKLLSCFLQNWRISSLISKFINGTETKEARIELLKTLVYSKEIYIPIFTPRLDEMVNAQLSTIVQQKFGNNLGQMRVNFDKNSHANLDWYAADYYEF